MAIERALLLTDIVDSTQLTEQLGDAGLARLWAAHDRLARDLLPAHRGIEIDKTDGFLLLFEAASDAVAYATAYHRALRALEPPLRARAGLHVGPVILTENRPDDVARGAKPIEVDGLAKPIAARVMSVASGGQTLLTAAARDALGSTQHRLESHGHWRLKGISQPLELFEVGDEHAPFTPPPDAPKAWRVVWRNEAWIPVRDIPHRLPRERDPFVGRAADLHELAQRLERGAPLVTVLGIGGSGKTRLVTHYGWTWLGAFPGGVWFCDLSEARSAAGICHAVATAFEVPLTQDDPVVQLGHAIAGRGRCLVLLDNFEQVARHAEQILGRWLDRAHEAQFVVTTREVLGLPGETTLALPPLQAHDAVELFVARARHAKRGFTLTDAERPEAEALVELLDRLPLAIELAAARVRLMAPSTLRARMDQRFRLLASSGRQGRQATLRATLDWSWELLSPAEQAGLAQLSVFEGGFTLEAAEAVLDVAEAWATDVVQALVDKSLVREVGEERFDLLVSVQEYAAERLGAEGSRMAAEVRHGAHYAERGTEEALRALGAHGGPRLLRDLRLEIDNLIAACRRAVARHDLETASCTAIAAWHVLELTGPFGTALEILSAAHRLAPAGSREQAVLERALGEALADTGRTEEARHRYETALALARALGDRRLEGRARLATSGLAVNLGWTDHAQDDLDETLTIARELADRGLEASARANLGALHGTRGELDEARRQQAAARALLRELGDQRREARLLLNIAYVSAQDGRLDEARAHLEAALAGARAVDDRQTEAFVQSNFAALHAEQGRLEESRACSEATLAIARALGDRRLEILARGALGNRCTDQGRLDEARACYEEAIVIARETGDRSSEAMNLGNLGVLELNQGRLADARTHLEAALMLHRDTGEKRQEGRNLGELARVCVAEARLDEARGHFEAGEALLREVSDRVGLGRLLCARAALDLACGDPEAARARVDEAASLAEQVGAGLGSDLGRRISEVRLQLA